MSSKQHEPAEAETPKESAKVTLNRVDTELLGRARGLVARANMEGPIEGVDDLSGVVNAALALWLPRMEKKHNGGESFPAPRRLPRGRKPSS